MMNLVRKFFRQHILVQLEQDDPQRQEQALQLATATLLFEMALADDTVAERERQTMFEQLREYFALDAEAANELVALAADSSRHLTCLQGFTRMLNETFSQQQKVQVVEMLWRVAFSDAVLDKYEELFVRRIADLLYVPHREFIAAKHRVLEADGPQAGQ